MSVIKNSPYYAAIPSGIEEATELMRWADDGGATVTSRSFGTVKLDDTVAEEVRAAYRRDDWDAEFDAENDSE